MRRQDGLRSPDASPSATSLCNHRSVVYGANNSREVARVVCCLFSRAATEYSFSLALSLTRRRTDVTEPSRSLSLLSAQLTSQCAAVGYGYGYAVQYTDIGDFDSCVATCDKRQTDIRDASVTRRGCPRASRARATADTAKCYTVTVKYAQFWFCVSVV